MLYKLRVHYHFDNCYARVTPTQYDQNAFKLLHAKKILTLKKRQSVWDSDIPRFLYPKLIFKFTWWDMMRTYNNGSMGILCKLRGASFVAQADEQIKGVAVHNTSREVSSMLTTALLVWRLVESEVPTKLHSLFGPMIWLPFSKSKNTSVPKICKIEESGIFWVRRIYRVPYHNFHFEAQNQISKLS